ncbi:alpha/beta fold hydrolase [Pseudonocardia acidicola]|uniref:alpha/beta fold hydrolase n=1 Tax=Pseudonocardia acidicola TaxID=2724939 RepID=UPI0030846DEB
MGRGHRDPSAVVLVLHGGRADSHSPAGGRKRLTYLRMLPFARMLASAGRAGPLSVYMLRYRYRGWNGPDMDAFRDAQWALTELERRHPGVPVVLLGHSMGGRAALRAAGAAAVVAVCALAPWLDAGEPVEQLAGRTVLIAHGDRERWTDPRESYAYAVRAKQITDRVCRFDVFGDGHAMLRRAGDWSSLVRRFVLGELGIEPEDPEISNALRQPAPNGLRAALSGAER